MITDLHPMQPCQAQKGREAFGNGRLKAEMARGAAISIHEEGRMMSRGRMQAAYHYIAVR